MRMANGTGGVIKLHGNRRKPYAARVTSGWKINDKGKSVQVYQNIGYYTTRNEALAALLAYNKNPYDLNAENLTFTQVYEKWTDEYFKTIVPSAQRTIKSAYHYSAPLHDMKFRDIRVSHLEGAIRDADIGTSIKGRMKSMYNLMYKFAMKHELCDKDYAALCDSVKRGKPVIEHIPFTVSECRTLWNNLDVKFVDMILIGIYSGFRPQELSILKIADIDLDNRTMMGGLKTDAGRNRIVPIHDEVYELVKVRYEQAVKMKSEYLFNDPDGQQGTSLTYDKYRHRWDKVMEVLHLEHRPHDTRHTFITYAKASHMDEYLIKLICGHSISDITERVYTHRTIEQLKEEMKKFKIELPE